MPDERANKSSDQPELNRISLSPEPRSSSHLIYHRRRKIKSNDMWKTATRGR